MIDAGSEGAEGVEVGIEAPAADDVPAGRWHHGPAEPGQQWAGEQERGANLLGQASVDVLGADAVGANRHLRGAEPVHPSAE